MDTSERNRVFDATMAEFLARGIDAFAIEGVARRAGLDSAAITAHWPDRRVLLMDVITTLAAQAAPVPDTGSLRGDLQALADSVTELVATPEGRRWLHRILPNGQDADLYEISHDFWDIRFDSTAPILRRAAARGELLDDVDPELAIRMFAGSYYFDAIFSNAPVRPEYAQQVMEIFIRGITR
ncbi:MAG: TetR/AcrR family transcriptional regulator [Mycobacterium sp.]